MEKLIKEAQFIYQEVNKNNKNYVILNLESNITMKGLKFENNKAGESGGSIYATSFLNLYIMNSSEFTNNYSPIEGGEIFA